MSSVHLKEFAGERGQPEAAQLLGVTQGALSKALRVGRRIVVTTHDDGSFSAEETRSFPARTGEARKRPSNSPTLNANLRLISLPDQSVDPAVNASSTSADAKLGPPKALGL